MSIDAHTPWPGMALFTTEHGSILYGVPADAFKATKVYCTKHDLAMPIVLVSPQEGLVDSAPQFVPEFFLYDFLFIRGAAFKPELADEKLLLVVEPGNEERELNALRLTLFGPSREELESYQGNGSGLRDEHVDYLARISEHMAIKRGASGSGIRDMVETTAFDAKNSVSLFNGSYQLTRTGPFTVELKGPGGNATADISTEAPVHPFNPVPVPDAPFMPMRFGLHALGVRGGFDPSGPTTGFLIWSQGRGILFDGPPKARQVLDQQGIAPRDIEALILSHCHEDHMASFAELVLELDRPRVLTAEPIYRSALQKLATNLQMSEDQVAGLIDYEPISPGEIYHGWGSSFEFFYTVHPIPTLGVTVTSTIDNKDYRITLTGDTLDFDGLDKMKDAGVITGDERDAMHAVIPDQRLDDAVFYADVGESLIHGHPKDWSDNPNDIHYYHCPETEHTQSFNHPVARAGQAHIMVPGPDAQTLAASRLLHALAPLESEEPGRVTEDLLASATRSLDAGDTLVAAGETLNAFTVILAGAMEEGSRARRLRSGDGIGLFYGVDDSGRASHDVVALSPTVVLEVTLEVLEDHLRAAGLSNLPGLIRRQLPFVERVEAFRSLSVSDRCRLARQLHLEPHAAGSSIPSSEDDSDVVLLLEGELRRSGLDIDAANGCKVLSPSDTRSQAVTEVVLGKLPRWLVDELRQHRMAVRIGLESLTR